MKKQLVFIALLIVGGLIALSMTRKNERTGYVQIQKVFNGFDYKKEMEANLQKVDEVRRRELDSLELDLKMSFRSMEVNKKDAAKAARFQLKRDAFLEKRKIYGEDREKEVAQYDEIIIKQMNQYIREFGGKNNYKYIFGADGNGTLMYADSATDLTEAVITFINEKFRGKTK